MAMTRSLGLTAVATALLLAVPGVTLAQKPAPVTFAKDVAPIFQAKCQSCHEPGSIAPMSLATYKDARPWARSIKQRVQSQQMPPWHIDRSVGVQKFKNDMSLTDKQVELIVSWVDQGAPEGNAADFTPKSVATGLYWQAERDGYGPPDLVITAPMQTMPAVHQDVWWRPVSEPDTYLLHVTVNDLSGPGGGATGCCWTTALLNVNVKGGSTNVR